MRTMSRTARMMLGARRWVTLLDIGSSPRKQGKFPAKDAENGCFTVLDLTLGRTVNGADCRPDSRCLRTGRDGAIAQLGERVVRNDEVGGSIPPGSTSLRLLRKLRLRQTPTPHVAQPE